MAYKIPKAKVKEQRVNSTSLLGKYVWKQYYKSANSEFFRVVGVPTEVAKTLYFASPPLTPNSRQNDSPKMSKMVKIAEKYNGVLEGYVIPIESKREDARVTFDGFIIKVDEKTALALKKLLKPDEFSPQEKGYRFWWD